MDIQDRVALVTGAGTGTGQAISQRLAERGATVALTDVPGCAETSRRIHEATCACRCSPSSSRFRH
jgi:NAD(P)-dependent dehydrogenase (short-subunit alcohol dehydrogenase family)